MPTVFLNGSFVERDAAMVSAFDAGFQHGVGLFETMLAVRAPSGPWHILDADAHLDRLATSAKELRLTERLRVDALREALIRTVDRAGEETPASTRLRVRLTITGGDLNMLDRAAPRAEQHPTLLIVPTPATQYPAPMFEKGVRVSLADWKANPLDPMQGHKTLNYWPRLRELQVAGASDAAEALVFQVTNHLAGGCVSNAILIKGGTILTPIARGEESEVAGGDISDDDASRSGRAIMPSPVLPGIVRRWALDWANAQGIHIDRRMLTIDDVLSADELILTNSSWGVLPVVAVESHAIGTAKPGEIGSALIAAWQARSVLSA